MNQANTFEAVARLWWAHWKDGKSERHAAYAIKRLEADAFPVLGSRPIASLTTKDLTRMAKAVQDRGAIDLAHRVLQMAGQVMRYAVAHDLIERNPATDVKPSDTLKSRRKENYARLGEKELPELLRKIEAYQGGPYTRLAMQLMALTFVRTTELIAARWAEFDLQAAEWRIPPERMKMKTPHIVPLSPQAVEVLKVLHTPSWQVLLAAGKPANHTTGTRCAPSRPRRQSATRCESTCRPPRRRGWSSKAACTLRLRRRLRVCGGRHGQLPMRTRTWSVSALAPSVSGSCATCC